VGIHLAEHAFALLLGLTRGVHTALREPDFRLREPIRKEQRELWEQTMGIVGFGGTGRAVARRALGFGMRVVAVDIEDVPREPGVEAIWKTDRLHDLLAISDVVVIALPLTKATHHLFTRDLFRRMQRHAIFVNVTRVIVTPHTAGGSPRRAGRAIATFCENLRRLGDGRPLLALVDKRKGY